MGKRLRFFEVSVYMVQVNSIIHSFIFGGFMTTLQQLDHTTPNALTRL